MSAAVRTLLALVLAALVFAAWPSPLNATFPNVELGRGRTPLWEPAWWAVLLLVVAIPLRRPFASAAIGRAQRLIGTLCCLAVIVWVFLPAKADIHTLGVAESGLNTMPILGGDARVWSRSTVEGNAVLLARAEMMQEYALMLLAGGIHEVASGPSVVRTALWTAMRGVANVAIIGRLVAVPLVTWVAVMVWRDREPLKIRRLVDGALRALVWLLPAANLLALLIGALTLPDDAALRLHFGLTWGLLALAVGAAHALGRRPEDHLAS
jgi:hypothetical protein